MTGPIEKLLGVRSRPACGVENRHQRRHVWSKAERWGRVKTFDATSSDFFPTGRAVSATRPITILR
jgi:hypothetical protein